MKISNEQMKALQESEARRKQVVPTAEGFENLLSEKLQEGQAQSVAPAIDMQSAMLQGVVTVPHVQHVERAGTESGAESAAMTEAVSRLEGVFASAEQYANQLKGQDGSTLRAAYATLKRMSKELAALKNSYPGMDETQPQLAAMVNELDVLVQTETFKLNRGDYL